MGKDAEIPVVLDPSKDPKGLARFTRKVAMMLNALVRNGSVQRTQIAGIKGDSFIVPGATGGSVTTVSVVSANGFAGTVANPTTAPAITLKTTVTGLLKGNGTAISAAVADTDYATPAGVVAYAQPLDADLTALAALAGTNTIYYRSAANTWTAVTVGSNLTFAGGTLAATGGGSGSVTTVSVVTANGVSGSVANPTTTPAITITLGAITPSSVNGNTITTGTGTLTLSTFTLTVAATASVSGTNTGDQTITLTGDVTGTGTGSFAATIANGVVTLAKIANAAANSKLLGSGAAGSGSSYVEITIGTGLTMTGTTLSATGGGGSVSVTDGSTTVSSVTSIVFTSGATVTSGGAGIANVAVSGGGGGVNGWEHSFTKPTIAGVTRVNTTGFTDSDDTNGLFIYRSGALSNADNISMAHVAVPGSGAWNLDVRVQQMIGGFKFACAGAHLYEAGTGKIITFSWQAVNTGVSRLCVNYFTNTTTFSSQPKTTPMLDKPPWYRIHYDGTTNYTFFWSYDGYSWVQFGGNFGKTALFTTGASHAGFFLDPNDADIISGVKCMSLTCA